MTSGQRQLPPGNPDTPAELVHFTGRTRGEATPLPAGVPSEPLDRLESIIATGRIRGFRVGRGKYQTIGSVVCFSELSTEAVDQQMIRGFTYRGPYDPYGLIIRKHYAIAAGARQVWYVADDDEWDSTSCLPEALLDRRVLSLPGSGTDWTHEREWRMQIASLATEPAWDLPIGAVAGIITGDPYVLNAQPIAPAFHGVEVWLFANDRSYYAGRLGVDSGP